MFSDYKKAIVEDYKSKKASGSLSLNLMEPTPGSIKNEWLIAFETRRIKADIKTLRLFFGEKEDEDAYRRALEKIEVDRFRPLWKFLKNKTENPEDRIIELLAWLIDFTPRPFQPGFAASQMALTQTETSSATFGQNQELSEKEASTTIGGQNTQTATASDIKDVRKEKTEVKPAKKYKGAIVALCVAITIATGSFIFHQYKPQCMYWNGHNYVAADCSETIPTSDVIALDESALQNLRWITRADTISAKHINKIWYIRNNNMVELFTSGGQYPPDRKRRLFPLSKTIYNNYVAAKKVKVE